LKTIVAALLSSDDGDIINRLLDALLNGTINEGKILFAQLLAERYK